MSSSKADIECGVKLAGHEAKDRLYEPKRNRKLIRAVTVLVYVLSVSLAGIILSLYYVFFWSPTQPHVLNSQTTACLERLSDGSKETTYQKISGQRRVIQKSQADLSSLHSYYAALDNEKMFPKKGITAEEGSRETPKVLPQREDTTPSMIMDEDEATSSELPGSYLVPD